MTCRLNFLCTFISLTLFLSCQDSAKIGSQIHYAGISSLGFAQAFQDLGKLDEGDGARALFPFEVSSEDSIQVVNFESSCGCLSAGIEIDGKERGNGLLLPGEKGFLFLDLNTSKVRGKRSANAKVVLDNGEVITCTISAYVKPLRETFPSIIEFGEVLYGDSLGQHDSRVQVKFRSRKIFEVIPQSIEIEEFSILLAPEEVKKNEKDGWSQVVWFSAQLTSGSGEFRGPIKIRDKYQGDWLLWATGAASEGLVTMPPTSLDFGICEQEAGGTLGLELFLSEGVENLVWNCDSENFRISEIVGSNNNQDGMVNLQVSSIKGLEAGRYSAAIILQYDWNGRRVNRTLPLKAFVR